MPDQHLGDADQSIPSDKFVQAFDIVFQLGPLLEQGRAPHYQDPGSCFDHTGNVRSADISIHFDLDLQAFDPKDVGDPTSSLTRAASFPIILELSK